MAPLVSLQFRPAIVVFVGHTADALRDEDTGSHALTQPGSPVATSVYARFRDLCAGLDEPLRPAVGMIAVGEGDVRATALSGAGGGGSAGAARSARASQGGATGDFAQVFARVLRTVQGERRRHEIENQGYPIPIPRAQIYIVGHTSSLWISRVTEEVAKELRDDRLSTLINYLLIDYPRYQPGAGAARTATGATVYNATAHLRLSGANATDGSSGRNAIPPQRPTPPWVDDLCSHLGALPAVNFSFMYEEMGQRQTFLEERDIAYVVAEALFGFVATGLTAAPSFVESTQVSPRSGATLPTSADFDAALGAADNATARRAQVDARIGSMGASMILFPRAAVERYCANAYGAHLLDEWATTISARPLSLAQRESVRNSARDFALRLLHDIEDRAPRPGAPAWLWPELSVLGDSATRHDLGDASDLLFRQFTRQVIEEERDPDDDWAEAAARHELRAAQAFIPWRQAAEAAWSETRAAYERLVGQTISDLWLMDEYGLSRAQAYVQRLDDGLTRGRGVLANWRRDHLERYQREARNLRARSEGPWTGATPRPRKPGAPAGAQRQQPLLSGTTSALPYAQVDLSPSLSPARGEEPETRLHYLLSASPSPRGRGGWGVRSILYTGYPNGNLNGSSPSPSMAAPATQQPGDSGYAAPDVTDPDDPNAAAGYPNADGNYPPYAPYTPYAPISTPLLAVPIPPLTADDFGQTATDADTPATPFAPPDAATIQSSEPPEPPPLSTPSQPPQRMTTPPLPLPLDDAMDAAPLASALPGELRAIIQNLGARVAWERANVPTWGQLIVAGAMGAPVLALLALALLPPDQQFQPEPVALVVGAVLGVVALACWLMRWRALQKARRAEEDLLSAYRIYYAYRCEQWEDQLRIAVIQPVARLTRRARERLDEIEQFIRSLAADMRAAADETERDLFIGPSGLRDVFIANGQELSRHGYTLADLDRDVQRRRQGEPLEPWHRADDQALARLRSSFAQAPGGIISLSEREIESRIRAFTRGVMTPYLSGDMVSIGAALKTQGERGLRLWQKALQNATVLYRPYNDAPELLYVAGRDEVRATVPSSALPSSATMIRTSNPEWLLIARFWTGGAGTRWSTVGAEEQKLADRLPDVPEWATGPLPAVQPTTQRPNQQHQQRQGGATA